jgi:hypothetical protein
MVKRENDPWIIAKRSDMRELMIIVNQRTANLKEINGKKKRRKPIQRHKQMLIDLSRKNQANLQYSIQ